MGGVEESHTQTYLEARMSAAERRTGGGAWVGGWVGGGATMEEDGGGARPGPFSSTWERNWKP